MKSGMKVKAIYFPKGDRIFASEQETLETYSEHHGEYDLDWVIALRDGKETARHNIKFIESIVWLNPESRD